MKNEERGYIRRYISLDIDGLCENRFSLIALHRIALNALLIIRGSE